MAFGDAMVTLAAITSDDELMTFIDAANSQLAALGYTEHGRRHAGLVSRVAGDILQQLGYAAEPVELARIAGYLHDVGNLIHREAHALSGALIAMQGLRRLGMAPADVALVMAAIGNHEEERGIPVQSPDKDDFDIHDRVNYAATDSSVVVDADQRVIVLRLTIDANDASVMNYFEIFLSRMVMMRQAAHVLGCDYHLIINDVRLS
jgi:hypothetical protein